jgi:hypothetical protein
MLPSLWNEKTNLYVVLDILCGISGQKLHTSLWFSIILHARKLKIVISLNFKGMYAKGIDKIRFDNFIDNILLVIMVVGWKKSRI